MITTAQIRQRARDLDRLVREEYKPQHPPKKRDWRTYEEQWAHRIRQAMRDLDPLVEQACAIAVVRGPGPPHALTRKQRVLLLLLKALYQQSNRRMAGMLQAFSSLAGIDVSYKTVKRLYSDPEVALAVENLHRLMHRRRELTTKGAEATGDGTGFALSITQHYASTVQRQREKAKENPPAPSGGEGKSASTETKVKKVKRYVYAFRLMDLRTRLYVALGTSQTSERAAYEAALAWLTRMGIEVESIRLDRYYSFAGDAARFPGARFYVLPRKDSKVHLQSEWLHAMREFVERTTRYLEEYYRREHSEAGFSADKRMLGWSIAQRRADRIDMAQTVHGTWHNLLNLNGPDYPLSTPGGSP